MPKIINSSELAVDSETNFSQLELAFKDFNSDVSVVNRLDEEEGEKTSCSAQSLSSHLQVAEKKKPFWVSVLGSQDRIFQPSVKSDQVSAHSARHRGALPRPVSEREAIRSILMRSRFSGLSNTMFY